MVRGWWISLAQNSLNSDLLFGQDEGIENIIYECYNGTHEKKGDGKKLLILLAGRENSREYVLHLP